jgi:hypothetical protein
MAELPMHAYRLCCLGVSSLEPIKTECDYVRGVDDGMTVI